MACRIGVDIGGTFTDLIFYDEDSGEVLVGKAPTTIGRPEDGCEMAIDQVGLSTALSRTNYFLHGTTVGLNALIERRGAVVGLLCTAGFRDILEFRRGSRKNFNLKWTPPPPLVPRRLRLGVKERMLSDGSVHVPFKAEDVLIALETFRKEGVSSIAVAFMNAYSNGEHERKAEQVLREAGFDGAISLSHRVSGEYREYERTSTTVIDAFVRSRMAEYLSRLDGRLRTKGFSGASLITRSGGGSMTFAEASERPFETIMSGPVAGAEGAAELSRRLNLGDLITADVGGTSFDTCVIVDGRPQLLYQGEVVGLPVQTPWVDVRSIGAGGGSIARVDIGGLLRVGPESAGALPGPVCYGRGGVEPTVTDAALCLGMLGGGHLASGIVLDRPKAEAALAKLGVKLGCDGAKVAQGVMAISAVAMANTIREITIDRGLDPRKMKLLAFGGAGPLMATEIARALDIPHIAVPPHAGNFSAWGLLGADLLRSEARTRILRLGPEALAAADEILDAMFANLEKPEDKQVSAESGDREVAFDMRFRGQEHTLTVSPPAKAGRITGSSEDIARLFRQEYRRTFATELDAPMEIVSIRAALRRPLPRRDGSLQPATAKAWSDQRGWAYSFVAKQTIEFSLIDRSTLPIGERRHGPMIISELTTTTYVDADFSVEIDTSGCMHLYRKEVTQ